MSTLQLRAFRPLGNNKTVSLAVTAAEQKLTIPDVPFGTRSVRLVNLGTDTIFIEFVQLAQTAAVATSMPMLPKTVEVFTLANDVSRLSVIGTTTTSTLYVTYGEGL